MTPEEREIATQDLPPVVGRGGRSGDVPGIQTVSLACGLVLEEKTFRDILRDRSRIVICWVATCKKTGMVRGYVVYELKDNSAGERIIKVLDMAAGDPAARRHLIEEMNAKELQHRRALIWATPTY